MRDRRVKESVNFGYDPDETRLRINHISNRATQKKLAELIGILPKSVSDSMNGIRQWKTEELIKLADAYNSSVDYILGRKQEASHGQESSIRKACMEVLDLIDFIGGSAHSSIDGSCYTLSITGLHYEDPDMQTFTHLMQHRYALIDFISKYNKISSCDFDEVTISHLIETLISQAEESECIPIPGID